MSKSKIIIAVLLSLLFCTIIVSCGKATSTDTSLENNTPPSDWILPSDVTLVDGRISYSSNTEPTTVRAASELSDNFTLSANIVIEGKGYAKLFFESEFDEKGEIKNGICITIDSRTGLFGVHLYNRYNATSQSSNKFDTSIASNYTVVIERNKNNLDSYLYNTNDKRTALAYSSLSLKQLKGTNHAVSMLGNVSFGDFIIGDVMENNVLQYSNPILAISKDLGDPTVYYEDGKYYMMTTGRMNCYVSEDLVNFTDVGVVANTSELYGHTYFGGGSIFKHDGIYYLFYTSYLPDTKIPIMCVATSDKVTGPYTQTKQATVDEIACPKTSAGAFPFIAEDGKTYLYWYETLSETGNTIFGAEAEFKDGVVTVNKETKKRLVIPTEAWEKKSENDASGRVVERPNVYYHNGYYYLFYAGSHWKTSYGQGYAVSKSPLGDFEKYENNPILDSTTSLHGVGCSYVVKSPDGTELFLVYHAHATITSLQRNVCIDRIYFENNGDGADIAKVLGPTVTPQTYPK